MDRCTSFRCDRCGCCCRNLRCFGTLYAALDNGHGVCRYYDVETRLCSIYTTRPILCRVEEGHEAFFRSIPKDEYFAGVRKGCEILKRMPDSTC